MITVMQESTKDGSWHSNRIGDVLACVEECTVLPSVPNSGDHFLEILLIDIIAANVFSFLCPADSLEVLFICKAAFESPILSFILLKFLGLEKYHRSEFVKRELGFISDNPRQLVVHAVRKLGFNCSVCYAPLEGPNGLFACTNTCTPCAVSKFKSIGAGYVEGTVRQARSISLRLKTIDGIVLAFD